MIAYSAKASSRVASSDDGCSNTRCKLWEGPRFNRQKFIPLNWLAIIMRKRDQCPYPSIKLTRAAYLRLDSIHHPSGGCFLSVLLNGGALVYLDD